MAEFYPLSTAIAKIDESHSTVLNTAANIGPTHSFHSKCYQNIQEKCLLILVYFDLTYGHYAF